MRVTRSTGRPGARVRTGAAATVVALGLVGSAAICASPAASALSPVSSTSKKNADEPGPLTADQLRQQVAQATALQKALLAANAKAAKASETLAQLSAQSQTVMAQVAAAKAAEATARTEEQRQLALLAALAKQAQDARDDVHHMAYDAYVNGSGLFTDVATILDLVTNGAANSQSAATVDYLAGDRTAEGVKLTTLAQAQQSAAAGAVAARVAREAATAKAQAAQDQLEAAIAAQQAALQEWQAAASGTAVQLRKLGFGVDGNGVTMADLAALATVPLCTQDTGNYQNGFIPASALCPIDGNPGQMMRPAAARALNALQKAYAKAMGKPLCITDTYRSYAAQVDVKKRKPTLAATPGTSNHGWGLATDLCGGIQSFGTADYLWMKQNAPLFGFYHPSWAEPTGSKPEPWHWEFIH